jgi:hypothetical protein
MPTALYPLLLATHSIIRWGLLAFAILLVGRCARVTARGSGWTTTDDRLSAAFVGMADTQLLVGLSLYLWVSPWSRVATTLPIRGLVAEPSLAFFAIVHPMAMLAGFVLLHGVRARARAAPPLIRARITTRGVLAWVALVIVSIPWPGLPWGRPLLPTIFAPS